jgi:ribosomal protein S18 acetylase RimI-like enzyme
VRESEAVEVRPATDDDVERCLDIVRGLPDWFTPDVPDTVRADITRGEGWVVAEDGVIAGFAVVERRSGSAAEILWAAVDVARRGSGLGTMLIDVVLDALAADGVAVVEVKTLDRSAGYEPYVSTLAFWEGRGFVQIDSVDPLPGWQPGNPSAFYVCALARTR